MWGMILGKSGKVPGKVDQVLVDLAKEKGYEFTDADPHTLLENNLDDFKKEMKENGWDFGKDDEELFELAMHPEQYRTTRADKRRKTSWLTCKRRRMRNSAARCRKKNSPHSSTQKLTLSWLRSRDKCSGSSMVRANVLLPLSHISAKSTPKAINCVTFKHRGASLWRYLLP